MRQPILQYPTSIQKSVFQQRPFGCYIATHKTPHKIIPFHSALTPRRRKSGESVPVKGRRGQGEQRCTPGDVNGPCTIRT